MLKIHCSLHLNDVFTRFGENISIEFGAALWILWAHVLNEMSCLFEEKEVVCVLFRRSIFRLKFQCTDRFDCLTIFRVLFAVYSLVVCMCVSIATTCFRLIFRATIVCSFRFTFSKSFLPALLLPPPHHHSWFVL